MKRKDVAVQQLTKGLVSLVAVLASACGGGGGGGTSPVTPGGGPTPAAQVSGKLTLSIPAASASAASRRAKAVSPSAQSVAIVVQGYPTTQIADVSSGSPNCVAAGAGRTCTVTIFALPGTDAVTVTVFDKPNATGTQLQTGSTSITVQSGQTFSATVAVASYVATVAVRVAPGFLGVSGSLPVTITARDPDENVISGPYATPIVLTNSDTSGVTALSATTVTSSTQAVSIAYNGAALSNAATITATAGSLSGSTTFTPNTDDPLVNGSTSAFTTTLNGTSTGTTGTPQSANYTFTTTYTVKTNQSFNNLTGLVGISNSITAGTPAGTISNTSYLMPASQGSSLAIAQAGQVLTVAATSASGPVNVTLTDAYTAPFPLVDLLPHAAGTLSPAYAASTETISVDGGLGTVTFTNNLDGSYSATGSATETSSSAALTFVENSDGSGSGAFTLSNPPAGSDYKDSVAFAVPTGATTAVTLTKQATSSSSPVATTTNVPNWLPGGKPPSPLVSQTVTDLGSVTRPAACALSSGYPATLTDVQTVQHRTDPMLGFVYTSTIDQYSMPGAGTVCEIGAFSITEYDSIKTGAVLGSETLSTVSTLTAGLVLDSAYRGPASGLFLPNLMPVQAQALRVQTMVNRLQSLETSTRHV